MTSLLRIRRRHCLPEGNLGLSKPSYDEKAGAPARSIDLTTAFADPDASSAVQLSVSLPSSTGTFTIALDGQYKPVTVGNFWTT